MKESRDDVVPQYNQWIDGLEALIREVEELRLKTRPIPNTYGDISDLPIELISELAGIKVDELEDQIFNIIRSGEGEVDLDRILIELYRRFRSIQTRRFLQNKTYRMAQKGLIYSVPGRKGVYTATKPDEAAEAPAEEADMEDWEKAWRGKTPAAKPKVENLDDEIPF